MNIQIIILLQLLKNNRNEELIRAILTAISTKLVGRFSRLICELTLKAIQFLKEDSILKPIDYFKIQKIPIYNIQKSNISGYVYEPKKKWYEKMWVNFAVGAGVGFVGSQFIKK